MVLACNCGLWFGSIRCEKGLFIFVVIDLGAVNWDFAPRSCERRKMRRSLFEVV